MGSDKTNQDIKKTQAVEPFSEVELPDGLNCETFEKELEQLINKHSIENTVDMPDFVLAAMLCRMIEAMGPSIKKTLDWHGCDSICHMAYNG